MSKYEPTAKQEQAIREYLHEAVVPLIEDVLVKKLGQAMAYLKEQQRPEQEPVAWGFQNTAVTGSNRWMYLKETIPSDDQYRGVLWTPLYTAPPKKEWVGLTADELNMIVDKMQTWNNYTLTDVYYGIEAKLKEKNT